tara:strand:+ start:300 stop:824 length:525 start_codon:yes stop_codon:yes gene_type:complete
LNSFPDDLVPLGKIIKPHGVKGELKVFLYNDRSSTLKEGLYIWFKIDEKFVKYSVINLRGVTKKSQILKIKEVDTFDKAMIISKKEFFVSRNDFEELDENSFYLNDLIGCDVFDEKNQSLGKILDVLNFPANDVLLISYEDKEIMVPFVEDFILLFDLDNRLVKLKNFKFLFEL